MANVVQILIETSERGSASIAKTDAELRGLTATGSGLSRMFEGLSGPGGAFGIAAIAAVGLAGATAKLALSFADEVEQLDNLSRASGATVQQIQVLRRVTENQGLAQDALIDSLRFLNREIAEQNPLLQRLGIGSRDAYGALLELSDLFSRSSDAAAKNKIAMTLLGRSGTDLIAVLDNLRGKVGEVQTQLGGGLHTEKALEDARRLDREVERLTTRLEGFTNRIQALSVAAANYFMDAMSQPANPFAAQFEDRRGTSRYRIGGEQAMGPFGPAGVWSDPNLASKLKEGASSLRDLARAYADFVEIDRKASQPTGSLFSALLGTGAEKAAGGTPGIREFVAQFERDNVLLADIARVGAFAIENSFATVFAGLLDKTQTFASAMKTIFIGLVQSILGSIGALLGRLAVFGIGSLIGGPVGAFIQTASGFRAGPARTIVNNYVQTLGVRDVIRQMTDPAGSMAMASRRLAARPA